MIKLPEIIDIIVSMTKISRATVSTHIRGNRQPGYESAKIYLKTFGGDLDEWITQTGAERTAQIIKSSQFIKFYKAIKLKELEAQIKELEKSK